VSKNLVLATCELSFKKANFPCTKSRKGLQKLEEKVCKN
jgi:hypothetical protein